MSLREPAWRMTTRELESSLEEDRSGGERPTGYLVSPFGARANRVVLAGTLLPPEPVGRSDPPTFWRSRLSDPLGSVAVTAGGFQPGALAQLRRLISPSPAVVVGKTHLYRGRDQVPHVSVRAEAVRPVGESEERGVLAEVVRHTLDRLDLLERLEHEPSVSDAGLRSEGIPALWIGAGRLALSRYPHADRVAFRRELGAAVDRVAGRRRADPVPRDGPSSVVRRVDPPPSPPRESNAADVAQESVFLDVLDRAADASADGYADVKEVLLRAAERGMSSPRAEELLSRLEESGAVEEPIVGKLRRA